MNGRAAPPAPAFRLGGPVPLTVAGAAYLARDRRATVVLDQAARPRIECARAVVDELVGRGVKLYGLSTGFASLRDRPIAPGDVRRLQVNLIRSHACGVGEPFPEDVVRAAVLLRAATLARGNSGVRPEVIEALAALFDSGLYVHVPSQGSVGASGDLAPLSHLVLALIGDPEARFYTRADGQLYRRGQEDEEGGIDPATGAPACIRRPDAGRFRRLADLAAGRPPAELLGFEPVVLEAKEGLALNNGAVFSLALAVLAAHDAARLVATSERVAALTFEALQAVPDCLVPEMAACRPQPGHLASSRAMREALAGSQLVPEAAPLGVNTAHLNRAARQTAELARTVAEPDRTPLTRLNGLLERLAAELPQSLAAHRQEAEVRAAAGLAGEHAYPKALELMAAGAAVADVRRECERLLGWDDGPSDLSPAGRRRLWPVYQDHIARLARSPDNPDVQDNYSLRAAATVLGAARDTLDHVTGILGAEMAASTDNPLILMDRLGPHLPPGVRIDTDPDRFRAWLAEGQNWTLAAAAVMSGANFHGQPVGLAADQLAAALAAVGCISERRLAVLTDERWSKGLPPFLSPNPGLNSGLMMVQVSAAALVSENKHLAQPATVDSIPTSESSEDHVPMSPLAARQCARVLEQVEQIVAMELLAAYQALQLRRPLRPGKVTGRVEAAAAAALGPHFLELGGFADLEALRRRLRELGLPAATVGSMKACLVDDIVLYPVLAAAARLVRQGRIADA